MGTSHNPENADTKAARVLLAIMVFSHPNIKLASAHVSGINDNATARDDVLRSMFLMQAHRSCYQNAPCGEVLLSTQMLEAMLDLATSYKFQVSEIAGGSHSGRSRHYAGVGFDVTAINGVPVSKHNKFVHAFMIQCKLLGATEVLGPGNKGHDGHVHAAWPRPK